MVLASSSPVLSALRVCRRLRTRNNATPNRQQLQQIAKTMTSGVTTSDVSPDEEASTDLGIAVDSIKGTGTPVVRDAPVLETTDDVATTEPVVLGNEDVATGVDTPEVAGAVVTGDVVAGAVVAGAVVAGAVVAGAVVVGMPVVAGETQPTAASSQTRVTAPVAMFVESNPPAK
jgi:hypothetical protein